jgi:hypothetical protein
VSEGLQAHDIRRVIAVLTGDDRISYRRARRTRVQAHKVTAEILLPENRLNCVILEGYTAQGGHNVTRCDPGMVPFEFRELVERMLQVTP